MIRSTCSTFDLWRCDKTTHQVNMLLLKINWTSPRLAPFHEPFSPRFKVPLALRDHPAFDDEGAAVDAAGEGLGNEATPSCAKETVFPAPMPRRDVTSVGTIADEDRLKVRPVPTDDAI